MGQDLDVGGAGLGLGLSPHPAVNEVCVLKGAPPGEEALAGAGGKSEMTPGAAVAGQCGPVSQPGGRRGGFVQKALQLGCATWTRLCRGIWGTPRS